MYIKLLVCTYYLIIASTIKIIIVVFYLVFNSTTNKISSNGN